MTPDEMTKEIARHASLACCFMVLTLVDCATTKAPVVSTSAPSEKPTPLPDTAPETPAAAAPGPGLRIEVEPSFAVVVVDGQRAAVTAGSGGGVLKVEAGIHQIVISCKGYQTWRGEVTVGDKVESIHVNLVPKGTP